MKAYLSGPMSGRPDWNYPAFMAAAHRLRVEGWEVFNPAEEFDGDTGLPFDVYLRHDLEALLDGFDAVFCLPGWRLSAGAILEVAVAVTLGIQIRGLLQYDSYVIYEAGVGRAALFDLLQVEHL